MADYKELLRRAISALPENNGAARRAVYEKARSALVGQLRAISPPLPARDITQHRLQLEDCIRQVEQEASEAVITLGREGGPARLPLEVPVSRPVAAATPRPVDLPKPVEVAKPVEAPQAAVAPVAEPATSIEDIISQAAATSGADVEEVAARPADKPARVESRPVPTIVPRADAKPAVAPAPSNISPLKSPSFETRRDVAPVAANSSAEPIRSAARIEPSLGGQALARQPVIAPIDPALSSVREVELEAPQPDRIEAEGAIERAIETLDREARGEPTAPLADNPPPQAERGAFNVARPDNASDDSGFADVPPPPRSGAGLTIFLVVFAILLAGVGGGGFWAWREGYVDLDQMFGRAQPAVAEPATQTTTPTLDPVQSADVQPATDTAAGPGNTATTSVPEPTVALEGLEIEDRLEPTPEPVVPTGTETALPSLDGGEIKGEERLTGDDPAAAAAEALTASVDPAVLAGSQSLLLEASPDGRTGAVPFSGTVEWTEGVDELGLPTLIGEASIPARNLGVKVTIRRNSDPSLPASHLMEVDFDVSDTFVGGAISNLPGVLLKDEELVPGTPLVGASARVVGNSFLFALSASEDDAAVNTDLLENRKWMDLAVVYGTGRNAILTLEKDEAAQAMFERVFGAWAQ